MTYEMSKLDPDKLKIGYVILAAIRKPAIQAFQQKAGYGESFKWTHVAGSIGGFDTVETMKIRGHKNKGSESFFCRYG
jgi:hypothetical protein